MIPLAGLGNFEGQRLEMIRKRTQITLGQEFLVDFPQDRVVKEAIVVYDWEVTPTFASGSPKLHHRGVAHALSKRVEIERAAGDVIKSYRGIAQLQDQARWLFGEECPTLYEVNASSLSAAALTGRPTLGSTTQKTVIREAYSIPFENKLTSRYFDTLLNLKGINTCKLRIQHGVAADVQDPDDSTSVTFAVVGYVTVYIATADHLADSAFMDWRQNYDDADLGSVTLNGSAIEFKPQGELQGFHLRAFKGTNYKPLTPEELRNFEVKVEYGGNFVFKGMLGDFQMVNGCKSSIRELFRSSAYMNIVNNSTPRTGLQTVQGGAFKPLVVTVSTPSSLAGTALRLVPEYDLIK